MGIETEQEKRDRHPRQDDIEMVIRRLDDPERDALERIVAGARKEGMSAKPQPTKPQPTKPHKTPDDLMTMREAAARARCSVKTFKGHVASGAIRYVIIGHGTKRPRKMIAPADLAAFIEAQTRKDVSCPSTEPRARLTGNTISGGEVIAFTAQPRPRPGAKPKR
jgi:hypothetical protein